MDFRRETVAGLAAQVRDRKLSAREVVSFALERIEALNGKINAFVAVDGERALSDAADLDERAARGGHVGPLAGIPIGVKDLEDVAGYPTTYGSAALASGVPAATDSLLVARMKAMGCVVVGKTNTPELGWKPDTENALFGATRNPWNLDHSAGGSSGGSAAAIAAGMVPLATGSDGGGSIRIPSSLCGLSGMKPSLGRVPNGGPVPPDWPSLSTKGPMARKIEDVVLALDLVVNPEPTDVRSLPRPEPSWLAALEDPRFPMKVAWSPTLGYAPLDDEVRAVCERAVRVIEGLGVAVVEVDAAFDEDPITPWFTLASAYCLRTLREVRTAAAWSKVDPGLAGFVEWASNLSALDLVLAEDQGHWLNLKLVDLFRDTPLLLTPTVASPPPPQGGVGVINGSTDANWVRFTYPFNLTRSPAATVCAGFTGTGLPVGIQLVGAQHGDQVVLRSAAALEMALGLDPITPI